MMTKFMKRTALASIALLLASCANDEFTGDKTTPADNGAIAFNMQANPQVRNSESGSNAATKLGKMFIVWGEKNEADGAASSTDNTVFKNYVVKYTDGSANTTTSNTKGWEYVGIDHSNYDTNVKDNIGANVAQTIKYWDNSASSYTFTAVSAKEDDIKDGHVKITKTTTGNDVYSKGYTIEVGAKASTSNIYYADRNNIAKGSGYTHEAVKMTFRNFETKIRFAMYETIPGYKVVVTGVKYNSTEHASTTDAVAFGVDGSFITAGTSTKYTVTYESSGDNQNKAKVAVDGSSATAKYCTAGSDGILKTTKNSPLGTASNNPTYDEKSGAYTSILPNPSNSTNMTLTVSYDLYSEDTGEKISFKDQTAVVPAAYCQWKSNYAYTYLFKISDKSVGLQPITFDAVVVTDEVGKQETITTVDLPSITTFGYDETNKTVITDKDEYVAGNTIYASVVDGTGVVTLSDSNVKLYTVESTDATNFPITEASVANAITNNTTNGSIKTTVVSINTTGTDAPCIVSEVPTEDGTTRTLSALKWKPTQAATYAVEYTKDNTKTYKIVKVAQSN